MKQTKSRFSPSLWALLLLSTLFQFVGPKQVFANPPLPGMVLEYQVSSLTDTVFVPLPGTNNCTIEWGDGSNTVVDTSGVFYHVYATTGLKTVMLMGTATHFGRTFDELINSADLSLDNRTANLIRVTEWNNLGLTSLIGAFLNSTNLVEVPNTFPSTVTNLSFTFCNATSFNDPNISSWNVTNVDSMVATFYFASAFNQPLNTWNVSNVTTMYATFVYALTFNQPINTWNVSKVKDMAAMFLYAFAFNQPLNNWNVSNVTNMETMFAFDTVFNQDLSMWCVSQIPALPSTFNYGAFAWTNPAWLPNWGAACGPVACAQPTGITATPTHNSVVFTWTKAVSANATTIQFRVKNTGTWGGTTKTSETHTFNYLSANTTYEYRLRSSCGGNINSTFVSGEFTTSAPPAVVTCLAPGNINAVPGTNSVSISWDTAAHGTLYFIQIKPSASTWAQAGGSSTSGTTRTFNNLQSGTSYDYRIRTTCAPGSTVNGLSAFSAVGTFTTNGFLPGTALFDTENTSWSVYPNPTTDVVTLSFNTSEEAPMQLFVMDMTGRLLQVIESQTLIGNNQVQLSLGQYNTGLYIIKAVQNNEVLQLVKVSKQ